MDRLVQRAASPSYTPGRRDVEPLIEALITGAEEDAAAIRRALCRRPELAVPAAIARLAGAEAGAAGRLVRLLGQLAGEAGADRDAIAATLIGALVGDDAGLRRRAAVALGKLGARADAEAALLARLAGDERADVVRAVIEALGLAGGAPAEAVLGERRARTGVGDVEVIDAALLRLRRTRARPQESAIDPDAVPPAPLAVRLHCRAGLEPLLADELAALGLDATMLRGPIAELYRARLWTSIGFPLSRTGDPAEAIASAAGLAVMRSLTRGAIRYRIAFSGGGHRRAQVRAIARAIAERAPDLINDPTRTDWEAVIDDGGTVELVPRGLADPRFSYRVADVPAASHPTLAAALARVAFADTAEPAADVIWDPFCGSGLELIERARLGPARRLIGSDVAEAALVAARANLAAVGRSAELIAADALTFEPGPVTTIITNPPMGRRVARGAVTDLLAAFVPRAARLLGPGGRLVWIAPSPRRTDALAAAAGLRLHSRHPVDMGGFAAELQLWRRV